MREKDCCAYAIVQESTEMILEITAHSHSRNLIRDHIKEIKKKAIEAAKGLSTVTPRAVLADITVKVVNTLPGSSSLISSTTSIGRALQVRYF